MRIKKRTLSLFKVWLLRFVVIGVVFGFYYSYTKTSLFTITTYNVEGVDADDLQAIRAALAELANKKHFLVLPNNKIFTYDTNGITAVIRDQVTDLGGIDIRPVGFHTVHITVTLLTPLLRTNDGQAITKDGIVFFTKKDLEKYPVITIASSSKEMLKVNGLPFLHLVRDNKRVDEAYLDAIVSMSTKVSSIIFPVHSIIVESSGDISLTNASGTSQVLFLEDADSKKVWSTLVSAIDTEPLKSKLEKDRNNLLYLDVRYGNKVFYRFNDMPFQNGTGAAIIDPHAITSSTTLQAH